MFRKTVSVILLLALLTAGLCGCSGKGDLIFYAAVDAPAKNFDPQIVSDETGRMIVRSCYEGLVTVDALGTPQSGVAASWTVTDDGFDFRKLEPKLKSIEKPQTVETVCRFGFTKKIPQPDQVVGWARKVGREFPDVVTMLKPGEYRLAVSVGKTDGTPEIALPLEGQIGETRRYAVGKVKVE